MNRNLLLPITLAVSLALSACTDTAPETPVAAAPAADTSPELAPAADDNATAAGGDALLQQKLQDYFTASLDFNPIQATAVGIPGYDDQLPNFLSEDYRQRNQAFTRDWLQQVRAIERDTLSDSAKVSYDIFVYQQEQALAGTQYPGYLLPLNQMFNFPGFFAQMGSGNSLQPFRSVANYENWLARMTKAPALFDQTIANLQAGVERGVVQPRVVIEKLVPQLDALVADDATETLFWQPLTSFPDDITDDDRERLTTAYRQTIEEQLLPAYRRLRDYVRDQYLSATRDTVGYSALPDGAAWYNYQIATQTTTELSADEIHRFGLSEVERILGEMTAVKQEVNFDGDLAAFFTHLRTDDQFYYDNEADLLQGYRDLQQRIDAQLPKLFDVMPEVNYEVRAVEAFRAASSAGASYMPGAPDGSRPGVFYVNTHNLRAQPKYGMETLSLHEASPGHHFQLTIQQSIDDLPAFRRFGGFTAFIEGWALYAESLGPELGLFAEPYAYFGRLSDEQLRAMRLVVDTGLHAKGWSREQAIQYMLENSPMAETDAVAEVERYIAMPGQALAYKVGERVIRQLRGEAEQALGDGFDIRAFHRLVLTGGAMPLEVLQRRVREWIAAEQA
ncbi:MAG: DUF885 domain-containing protein [Wenzhouxiangellaceae bacterium]